LRGDLEDLAGEGATVDFVALPCERTMRLTPGSILGQLASEGTGSTMEEFEFHHVGVAVRELPAAIESYRELFGYQLTSGPFDDPIQNVSVCFLSRGGPDTAIELVAPLGPKSPIDGVLKKGGGTYHVCYQVAKIGAAIEHLTKRGAMLVSGPVPAVAFDLREIAWLLTDTGLLVEVVQAP
jgi:methylmalonyl-CoA/ethylmalonyl-CoA epimerase